MGRVDALGRLIGFSFSIMGVSQFAKGKPLQARLEAVNPSTEITGLIERPLAATL